MYSILSSFKVLTKAANSELLKPYPRKIRFDYTHAHQLSVALKLQIFASHEIHQRVSLVREG